MRTFRGRPRRSPKLALFSRRCSRVFVGLACSANSASGLGELISRITGRNTGALAPDAKLEGDLNLSSMDRVELMSALEDRYQVDLSEANFAQISTVGELERMLHEPQRAQQSGYRYPRWAQSLAGPLDSQLLLLPAFAAGDADHGAPDDYRPRKSRKH